MHRRTVLIGLAALPALGPAPAGAQRLARVAFVIPGPAPTEQTPLGRSILGGLAKAGYVPGKTLQFEPRGADGRMERLPAIIREVAEAGANVIVTSSFPAAVAAKESTTLPVVAINCGDPVGTGLVASLARPGGHVTGVSDVSAELTPKRMDLLRALSPQIDRIGILWNDGDRGMQLRAKASEAGARSLGIGVERLGLMTSGDFDRAFREISEQKTRGLLVVADTLTAANSRRIFEFAMAERIPVVYEMDFLAEQGGLMSYGPDPDETAERVGVLVDRILKGAAPADLPFEQPTRFKLVINLKTARALDIAVPPVILAAADTVIE